LGEKAWAVRTRTRGGQMNSIMRNIEEKMYTTAHYHEISVKCQKRAKAQTIGT